MFYHVRCIYIRRYVKTRLKRNFLLICWLAELKIIKEMNRLESSKVNISSSPWVCYSNLIHFSRCLNFAFPLQRFTQVTIKHEEKAKSIWWFQNWSSGCKYPTSPDHHPYGNTCKIHSTWADWTRTCSGFPVYPALYGVAPRKLGTSAKRWIEGGGLSVAYWLLCGQNAQMSWSIILKRLLLKAQGDNRWSK